jgi:hypothetical protein
MRQKFYDRIAILDLDGPGQISDPFARDQEAVRRVKVKFGGKEIDPLSNEYKSLFYARDGFFDERLLHLDKLNEGANAALERLRTLYTDLYVVTSRPDFLAEGTIHWLREHGVDLSADEIRFKLYQIEDEKREQYTTTSAYKAIITYEASRVYQRVLFVDNEEKNRRAVAALHRPTITIKASLRD